MVSCSSYILGNMSSLVHWRNFYREGGVTASFEAPSTTVWFRSLPIQDFGNQLKKIIITDIGLNVLLAISIAETVAYVYFICCCGVLGIGENKLTDKVFDLMNSSAWVFVWAIDVKINNLFFIKVKSHTRARNDFSKEFEKAWKSFTVGSLIESGAQLIVNDVLSETSAETRESVKICEAEIIPFVLTKAVFIYSFGHKKGERIPAFFKSKTVEAIKSLRKETVSETDMKLLENVIKTPDPLNELSNEIVKEFLKKLRAIAYGELEGASFLLLNCWERVTELLSDQDVEFL